VQFPITALVTTSCITCLAQQVCCRDLLKIALAVPSGNPVLFAIFRVPIENLISGRNKRPHDSETCGLPPFHTAQSSREIAREHLSNIIFNYAVGLEVAFMQQGMTYNYCLKRSSISAGALKLLKLRFEAAKAGAHKKQSPPDVTPPTPDPPRKSRFDP
jgi:hypothetical protein